MKPERRTLTASVRLPPPLEVPRTGDAALDVVLGDVYRALADGTPPPSAGAKGAGVKLVPCLVPALFDPGEVIGDDAALAALAPKERTAHKRDAELHERHAGARRLWRNTLLAELAGTPEGRAGLRTALVTAHPETRTELLNVLIVGATEDDYRAIADVVPEDAAFPVGCWGAMARLAIDPSFSERVLSGQVQALGTLACALVAVKTLHPPPATLDARWLSVAYRVLGDVGFAQFGVAIALRSPPTPTELEQILAVPLSVAEHAQLLARYDDVRVIERLTAFVRESSLADSHVIAALERSAHVEAAHAAFEIVADLTDRKAHSSRIKRFKDVAKAIGTRLGVKPTRTRKASGATAAAAAPPVVTRAAAPPLVRPDLPPLPVLERELRAAFASAQIAEHFDKLVSPALAWVAERADESTIPLGATRLGGSPDLPADTPWPLHRRTPLTFVGQLDLAALRSVESPLWPQALPREGLLSFFVHDADPENYASKGAVLYSADTSRLVRHAPPAAFTNAGRSTAAACKVELVETLQLIHPSHRVVTHGLPHLAAQAYEALRAERDLPLVSTFLGHRDRYDGEVKRGHRLLLQVTSDPQADFRWGDVDELAFFIAEKALAAREFDVVDVRVGD